MSFSNNFPAIRPSLLLDFASTKQLDPRITFARASTATFYDGKTTAKAEENLYTYSQDFDNAAWSKYAGSVTANTTAAPDGTTTADTFTADGTSNIHGVGIAATQAAGAKTASIYVKAGTATFVQIYFGGDVNSYANFNVTSGAGAVGSAGSATTASIVDAGGGWYRVVAYTNASAATGPVLSIVSSTTAARAETNTSSGTVILWGAQLEQRSSVTAYTATTTAPITNYIPVLQTAASGVARFDNNPTTGESLGLLIEEQRTNLLTYSDQFDNAAWSKSQTTVSQNATISPEGSLNADLVIPSISSALHQIYSTSAITVTSGTLYTYSVYAKAGGYTWLAVSANDGVERYSWFNLSDGTLGNSSAGNSASITSMGNGWYRCAVTRTVGSTSARGQFFVSNTGGPAAFAGDGYSGIYIWGAQLEAGAFATSYIATTSAQVTRAADVATMTGTNFSSWYRADEQSWYIEYAHTAVGGNGRRVLDVGGSGSDYLYLLYGNSSTGDGTYMTSAGTAGAVNSTVINPRPTTMTKVGFALKTNDYQSVYNGTLSASDTSFVMPAAMNRIGIGCNADGGQQMDGTIKKIAYYPARVTNAQLQALTS